MSICPTCGQHVREDIRLSTPKEQFWALVRKTDTCWLWTGPTRRGYGRFSFQGIGAWAHRYAYETTVDLIPEGMVLDHLCGVEACVNPAHLEPVAPKENTLRGDGPTARNARKTHCPKGHSDWVVSGTGWRRCRPCRQQENKRRAEQRRQQRHALKTSAADGPPSAAGTQSGPVPGSKGKAVGPGSDDPEES